MKPVLITAAGNPENQDRGLVIQGGSRTVLCVADGAGGLSGAAEAATMAAEMVRQNAHSLLDADSCAALLRKMDATIDRDPAAGETTCALAVVTPEAIFGASVGDSGVWLIPETGAQIDLTRGQRRKPFVGSGSAFPISFQHPLQAGWLLIASDGLLKYTPAEKITATCRVEPVEDAARQLLELVRYHSGALPDDVT